LLKLIECGSLRACCKTRQTSAFMVDLQTHQILHRNSNRFTRLLPLDKDGRLFILHQLRLSGIQCTLGTRILWFAAKQRRSALRIADTELDSHRTKHSHFEDCLGCMCCFHGTTRREDRSPTAAHAAWQLELVELFGQLLCGIKFPGLILKPAAGADVARSPVASTLLLELPELLEVRV
jgi:hypothetical protein